MYLPFSRTPDFFNSETTPALIKQRGDKIIASFQEAGKQYILLLNAAEYQSKIGQRVSIRYELSQPEKAKLNQAWGYWLIPGELAFAGGIFLVLLGIAFATTHKPDPNSLKEQLNYQEMNTTKYQ